MFNAKTSTIKFEFQSQMKQVQFSFSNMINHKIIRFFCKSRSESHYSHMYSLSMWLFKHLCDAKQYISLYKDMYFIKRSANKCSEVY